MANTHSELVILGHGNAVTALAFFADGKTLVSGSYDQTAIVWNAETGQMRRRLQLHEFVDSLALTPDGALLVTDDGHIWDVATGRRLRRSPRYIAPLACSPDGRTLACPVFVPKDGAFHLFLTDIRTGRTRRQFPCCAMQPHSIAFSSDGELVAVCSYDEIKEEETSYVTMVINLQTGETRQVLRGPCVHLFGVNLEPGVRLAAFASTGNQLWNAETGEILKTFMLSDNDPAGYDWMDVALSSDGERLAVSTGSGIVSVWSIATSERLWQAQAHRGWLRTLAFTSDGQILATAGDDHAIRLWSASDGMLRHTLGGRGTAVEAVAFTPDGQGISAIHEDGAARLWRISPPDCERQVSSLAQSLSRPMPRKSDMARNLWNVNASTLPINDDIPEGFSIAAVSPDGSLLALDSSSAFALLLTALDLPTALTALRSSPASLAIWNREKHDFQCILPYDRADWDLMVFSPDNRYLALSSNTGKGMRLIDTRSGAVRWEIADDSKLMEATAFAFSSDSRLFAAGHLGFEVTLWNMRTGKRKRILSAGSDCISALAFSPDARVLAVGTAYEKTVWLKSLTRGKSLRLVGHTDNIRSVQFSPDGTRIATGAQDATVRLWEAESGKLLATFLALPGTECVIYTPEGDYTCSLGAEPYILRRVGEDLIPVTQTRSAKEDKNGFLTDVAAG